MKKNKTAQKFNGRKVRVTSKFYNDKNDVELKEYLVKEYNIVENFDNFKHEQDLYNNNVELLEDNLILYYCDYKKTNDLGALCNIRDAWARNKFDFRDFYTKKEIKEFLENDCLIAIKGLGEIDLEDLDLLD